MSDNNQIQKEFIHIEPLDNSKLETFYLKNFVFLSHLENIETEELSIKLKMLIEIGCSYSFAQRHQEANSIFVKIEPYVGRISLVEIELNQFYFCAAQSNFALKNYRKALGYFKAYNPEDKEKENVNKITQLCRQKYHNKILNSIRVIGFTLLIVYYSTKYLITELHSSNIDILGLIGALALIFSGIYSKLMDKKYTA